MLKFHSAKKMLLHYDDMIFIHIFEKHSFGFCYSKSIKNIKADKTAEKPNFD